MEALGQKSISYFIPREKGGRGRRERGTKKNQINIEKCRRNPPPQSHTFTSKHAESRAAYKVHSHGKIKAGVTQSMLDAAAKKREEIFFFFWKEFN